ncbi:MAG: AmmeMemoRadiSam system protein A [Deltaproteobacteria bacterium]|nr:MAG: AmmeMemoRadiSam system protein A [Deltaproteobacteria bacterium]
MTDTERKPLPRRLRLRLLQIAREAILSKVSRGTVPEFVADDPELQLPSGAFVSLHIDGRLRGCIGTLYPEQPLVEAVATMAGEAATADPRFHPLAARDLRETDIEISVLTPFVRVTPEQVEPGRHGLYIARGRRRGVLLPQVATQYGWDREEFLAQTCHKAGLPPDAWRDPDTLIMAFEAQVFSDLGEAEAASEV